MEQQLRRQPSVRKKHRSTGRRGDTPLHSAARSGDLSRLRKILSPDSDNDDSDVEKPLDGRALIVRQNEAGETTLYAAADSGHAEILKELLSYADVDLAAVKTHAGSNALHAAAKHGHVDCVKELVNFCGFLELAMAPDSSSCTALYLAATLGHVEVVAELLAANDGLVMIAKNNGKTALHSAVRGGHLEVVRALLGKGADLCGWKDHKGQTPLHMAVKGPSVEVVKELLRINPSVINVVDKKGNTALHVATRKGREQIVRELLECKGIDLNALNKLKETALDVAEKSHFMEVASKIKSALKEAGAENGKHISQPKEARELKQTVSDIKHDVHTQLVQIEKTQRQVTGIVNEINDFKSEGISNTVNSVTVVAVLIATITFAAIFTVPGNYVGPQNLPQPGLSLGQAMVAKKVAFQIFFIFDSVGLFISLAVVVVQVSLVAWERKAQSRVIFVFNKLMWMACMCTSVAFIALSFIVVSHHGLWIAITVTIIGGSIILGTMATMCYFAVRNRIGRSRSGRKIRRSSRSRSHSWSVMADLSDSDIELHKIYVI